MRYEIVDPLLVDADPHNLRVITSRSVDEMAESIKQHGLLQNPVVEEPVNGRYICRSGNRRVLAVRKLLAEGLWKQDLFCLIVDDGSWSQIVENVVRQDVPIWRLGARFLELRAAGYTRLQIATRVGMTPGKTSMIMQIAEGLSPEIVGKLEKLPPNTLTITQLCNIARLFNPETLTPDFAAQDALLSKLLSHPRSRSRTNRPVTERQTVWRRYRKLREGSIKIPMHAEPYVDAVVRYLCGEDNRLKVVR